MEHSGNKKVFVVNRSSHDYSAAKKYGELIFVTSGRQKRYSANSHARVWNNALENSTPDDYILISSLNILCSIGCAVFAHKHNRLNLLLYRGGKYIKRELDLNELQMSEEDNDEY